MGGHFAYYLVLGQINHITIGPRFSVTKPTTSTPWEGWFHEQVCMWVPHIHTVVPRGVKLQGRREKSQKNSKGGREPHRRETRSPISY